VTLQHPRGDNQSVTEPGGAAPRHILVVDDEPYIADLVSMGLRYQGFEVTSVGTGQDALAAASAVPPDLIVLDVMLPDLNGLEVCRRLRDSGTKAPVIFLTARDAVGDRVAGLTIGGDDYVTKPFSLEELFARVNAVLRRSAPTPGTNRMAYADLVLDDDRHEVTRGATAVELTLTEYKLLRYLLNNAGRVVSKAQILDHVWHYDFGGDANVVETYVSYLRRKIDGQPPALIHTVRGVGYSLRLPRQSETPPPGQSPGSP
jgi:two-component system, OmpR family, response regulator